MTRSSLQRRTLVAVLGVLMTLTMSRAGHAQGACCLTDGTCVEIAGDFLDCGLLGGTFAGDGTTCADSPCAQGACCTPDGGCMLTTFPECETAGGTYRGSVASCDSACGMIGACCLSDGTCITTPDSFICLIGDGTWQGDGSFCADATCTLGGCCLPEGGCVVTDSRECETLGGSYVSGGTCEGCPGACCLQDGTCEIVADSFFCEAMEQGFWQGGGSECDGCLLSPGACCLPDGVCLTVGLQECAALGGYFRGEGSPCTECDIVGACCLPDGTCELTAGPFSCEGTWQGPGSDCDSCPGACCLPDGTCVITADENECSFMMPGVWLGGGTTCADAVCTDGACCLPDGTCVVTDPTDCSDQGGLYRGIGSSCTACDTIGACCLQDGSCVIAQDPFFCQIVSNGIWQGEGSVCDDCTLGEGGCCLPDGGCVLAGLQECATLGGLYRGEGSSCKDCVGVGACCLLGGACVLASDAGACEFIMNGAWQGAGSTCDAECQFEGACCFSNGTCVILSDPSECTFSPDGAGTWLGYGSVCADCCREDLNGNGSVGFADLTLLLRQWGPCPGCEADLDGNGSVGLSDLSQLLAAWGPCPSA